MRNYIGVLGMVASLAALPVGVGFAHGGGSASGGSMPSAQSAPRQPAEVAKAAYNAGVKDIKKAKDYDADASKAATPEKAAKAADKARKAYEAAHGEFVDAVGAQPGMYEAWNYLGFTNRHLGNYDDALTSYAKALELNPNYPDAIEYRGEAFLGLNRIDDAKGAYMNLFRDSRPLADELMVAMHRWTDLRRQDAQGVSTADIDAFAKWMEERSSVAAQTASLAIGALSTHWR
jgi:tetratricopeptide (TPR) repeat protein